MLTFSCLIYFFSHRIPIRIPPRQSVVESLPVGHTVPAVPVVDQPAWLSIEHANALLQRIEKEAAKKKELDRDWEDFTDGAFHPSPLPKPAQYWRSPDALPLGTGDVGTDRQTVRVFERQRSDAAGCSRPSFRRRVGRGGRVMLDRIGGERQRSRSETSHNHGLRSDRWKFDCDALELPLLQAPDILDDIELKHQVSRLGLYQPGDFTSLHVNPQHLHDSQKWINRPEDTPPPTQVVGRIPYRQAPPQPPVQPIAQQHQVSQAGPLPPGTGSMPGQLPMLPPSSNPLMALKRAPSHSGVGGSPQMPNGSPIPNGAMPQPPPGPRRMPSNHLLQQMPNSQMMAQWQSSNGMINTSKMDPATLQNLSSQIAQAQQNGMLATPRLPTQFPNGAPRMPAGYPNASPSGPFSDPSATGRPPSASPNQNQRSQMMPPQAQPQVA